MADFHLERYDNKSTRYNITSEKPSRNSILLNDSLKLYLKNEFINTVELLINWTKNNKREMQKRIMDAANKK